MVKKLNWREMRSLPPEKMALARRALEDVRRGRPLEAALREHLQQFPALVERVELHAS